MITQLQEFRNRLDELMLKCMHERIVLYGYDSYTGRFLKWYADYYHGIDMAYLVSEDMSTGRGYDREIFRPSVFDFRYKDINNAVIWIAQPMTKELGDWLKGKGYQRNITYFDFYDAIYGNDYIAATDYSADAFQKKKTGTRDIQFLEWLEYKYGCNFVTPIAKDDFEVVDSHGARYSCSTQKEIFPILDRCHVNLKEEDAIFDFGCGKGGAIVAFLDYGFTKVGGVKYEPKTYQVACDNFRRLGDIRVDLICEDAREVKTHLDNYNWFYFFFPFDMEIFKKVINNLVESYEREKRKIYIIYYTAMEYDFIESTGIFRLTNQFAVDSRQRVVGIFESKE